MKKEKAVAILHFISSICLYVCAVINFINSNGLGVVYLCLGTTFLCLGVIYLSKNKKDNDK